MNININKNTQITEIEVKRFSYSDLILILKYNINYRFIINKRNNTLMIYSLYIYDKYITYFIPTELSYSFTRIIKNTICKDRCMIHLSFLSNIIYSYFIYNKYYRIYNDKKNYYNSSDFPNNSSISIYYTKIFNCHDFYKIFPFI